MFLYILFIYIYVYIYIYTRTPNWLVSFYDKALHGWRPQGARRIEDVMRRDTAAISVLWLGVLVIRFAMCRLAVYAWRRPTRVRDLHV